jgi:hypothetical protein
VGDTPSLTVKILTEIRDEIRTTNTRVAETNVRIDVLREETNARLDFLAEGQVRLATEVAGLRGEVVELRGEVVELRGVVEKNGERFEHFLATEGDVIRDMKHRLHRVEEHLGLAE